MTDKVSVPSIVRSASPPAQSGQTVDHDVRLMLDWLQSHSTATAATTHNANTADELVRHVTEFVDSRQSAASKLNLSDADAFAIALFTIDCPPICAALRGGATQDTSNQWIRRRVESALSKLPRRDGVSTRVLRTNEAPPQAGEIVTWDRSVTARFDIDDSGIESNVNSTDAGIVVVELIYAHDARDVSEFHYYGARECVLLGGWTGRVVREHAATESSSCESLQVLADLVGAEDLERTRVVEIVQDGVAVPNESLLNLFSATCASNRQRTSTLALKELHSVVSERSISEVSEALRRYIGADVPVRSSRRPAPLRRALCCRDWHRAALLVVFGAPLPPTSECGMANCASAGGVQSSTTSGMIAKCPFLTLVIDESRRVDPDDVSPQPQPETRLSAVGPALREVARNIAAVRRYLRLLHDAGKVSVQRRQFLLERIPRLAAMAAVKGGEAASLLAWIPSASEFVHEHPLASLRSVSLAVDMLRSADEAVVDHVSQGQRPTFEELSRRDKLRQSFAADATIEQGHRSVERVLRQLLQAQFTHLAAAVPLELEGMIIDFENRLCRLLQTQLLHPLLDNLSSNTHERIGIHGIDPAGVAASLMRFEKALEEELCRCAEQLPPRTVLSPSARAPPPGTGVADIASKIAWLKSEDDRLAPRITFLTRIDAAIEALYDQECRRQLAATVASCDLQTKWQELRAAHAQLVNCTATASEDVRSATQATIRTCFKQLVCCRDLHQLFPEIQASLRALFPAWMAPHFDAGLEKRDLQLIDPPLGSMTRRATRRDLGAQALVMRRFDNAASLVATAHKAAAANHRSQYCVSIEATFQTASRTGTIEYFALTPFCSGGNVVDWWNAQCSVFEHTGQPAARELAAVGLRVVEQMCEALAAAELENIHVGCSGRVPELVVMTSMAIDADPRLLTFNLIEDQRRRASHAGAPSVAAAELVCLAAELLYRAPAQEVAEALDTAVPELRRRLLSDAASSSIAEIQNAVGEALRCFTVRAAPPRFHDSVKRPQCCVCLLEPAVVHCSGPVISHGLCRCCLNSMIVAWALQPLPLLLAKQGAVFCCCPMTSTDVTTTHAATSIPRVGSATSTWTPGIECGALISRTSVVEHATDLGIRLLHTFERIVDLTRASQRNKTILSEI